MTHAECMRVERSGDIVSLEPRALKELVDFVAQLAVPSGRCLRRKGGVGSLVARCWR